MKKIITFAFALFGLLGFNSAFSVESSKEEIGSWYVRVSVSPIDDSVDVSVFNFSMVSDLTLVLGCRKGVPLRSA